MRNYVFHFEVKRIRSFIFVVVLMSFLPAQYATSSLAWEKSRIEVAQKFKKKKKLRKKQKPKRVIRDLYAEAVFRWTISLFSFYLIAAAWGLGVLFFIYAAVNLGFLVWSIVLAIRGRRKFASSLLMILTITNAITGLVGFFTAFSMLFTFS